jgi:hypothetical protein
MEQITIVNVIQAMLAPGIMISACGLLILGMNNKYSIVVNRIRLLNEERRSLFGKAGAKEFNYNENVRFGSINIQLDQLAFRLKLVRNAVVCYTIAVALFVITSLAIGLAFFTGQNYETAIAVIFLLGMLAVLTGILYAAYESIKGYSIVSLEVRIDE